MGGTQKKQKTNKISRRNPKRETRSIATATDLSVDAPDCIDFIHSLASYQVFFLTSIVSTGVDFVVGEGF